MIPPPDPTPSPTGYPLTVAERKAHAARLGLSLSALDLRLKRWSLTRALSEPAWKGDTRPLKIWRGLEAYEARQAQEAGA